jgi:anti-sigma regulatory factor (Ser/Thr protein kinase)
VSTLRILVIAPCDDLAFVLCAELGRRGHGVTRAAGADEARNAPHPDAVVVAARDADACLDLARSLPAPAGSLVLACEEPTVALCREALRLGAGDVVPFTPDDASELIAALEAAEAATGQGFESSYPAEPASVLRAARDVAALALRHGAGPVVRARAASVCAELVDNAVRHAGTIRPIVVRTVLDAGELFVHVTDHGRGFDVLGHQLESAPRVLPGALEAGAMPRGIERASALAEDLDVRSSEEGTRALARFSCTPFCFDEDGPRDLGDLDFVLPTTARRLIEAVRDERAGDLFNVSPAIAVVIGRLLSGRTDAQVAKAALWSREVPA